MPSITVAESRPLLYFAKTLYICHLFMLLIENVYNKGEGCAVLICHLSFTPLACPSVSSQQAAGDCDGAHSCMPRIFGQPLAAVFFPGDRCFRRPNL